MYDAILSFIVIIIIVRDDPLSVSIRVLLHEVLHDATAETQFSGRHCDFP